MNIAPPAEPRLSRWKPLLRWIYPAIAYLILVPACYVGITPDHAAKWVADRLGHQINTLFIVASAVIVLVTAYRRRSTPEVKIAWWTLDIFLVTVIMGDIWKLVLNAPRPGRPGVPDNGFPSGHTMTAFAISFLVTEIDPRAGAVWYLLAAAVGWSRVEGVAHYPYQVLCGAPMGVVMAWAVTHIAQGVFFPRLHDMWRNRKTGAVPVTPDQ